jgi:hypothetical protein
MVVKVSKPEINVREKISELDKPSGTAGQAMLAAETPQEQFNLINAGRRNMLINANMTINQRGTANPVTVSANDNSVYPVDRWRTYANSTACVATINDVVLPNGHRVNSLKTVASGSGAWLHPYQTVEIESWMSGQTVTFSAWIRTNFTNQSFRICDGVSCYLIGDEFPSDGQWHYMTASYVLPNGMTTGHIQYHPGFGGACVANDYIEFACPQMELGKVATPFEYRQIAEELALCQRYLYSLTNGSTGYVCPFWQYNGNPTANGWVKFPVTMRAEPSLVYNTQGQTNWVVGYGNGLGLSMDTFTLNEQTLESAVLYNSQANFGIGTAGGMYVASTSTVIQFDAEL